MLEVAEAQRLAVLPPILKLLASLLGALLLACMQAHACRRHPV